MVVPHDVVYIIRLGGSKGGVQNIHPWAYTLSTVAEPLAEELGGVLQKLTLATDDEPYREYQKRLLIEGALLKLTPAEIEALGYPVPQGVMDNATK